MSAVETEVRQLQDRVAEVEHDVTELIGRFARSREAMKFLAALSGGATGRIARKVADIDRRATNAFGVVDAGFEAVFNRLAVVENAVANLCQGKRTSDLEAECQAKSETITELQDALAQARAERDQARAIAKRAVARDAQPTWTNTKGETHRVTDMPTPYLENVAGILFQHGLAFGPRGCGLYSAIQDELEKRRQEAA